MVNYRFEMLCLFFLIYLSKHGCMRHIAKTTLSVLIFYTIDTFYSSEEIKM
jgi:hypothetical protein